ncbi:MAG: polyprenyl synthetase family protein [Clostridia bacterium]|nr:polyprenyl synthetase family protein [Clostridia bacterium]
MERTYEEYKEIVDTHILDYLPSIDEKSITLYEAMKYSLEAGGKRLRPVLLLATCEFAGGDVYKALPYAIALEYIHTYSLIHDDLPAMDNDDLRRGIPTNHKVYGDAIAILAGDGLLNTASEIMDKDMFMYFDNMESLQRRINAAYVITKNAGCQGMVSGQVSDIQSENKKCSESMLRYIHSNKTGALILAAVQAGLYLAGADMDTFTSFSIYAQNLGLAFQIHDDIIDVTKSTDELGKPAGSDKEAGKSTYVSMYGLEKANELLDKAIKDAKMSIEHYYDNAEFFTQLVDIMARS